VQSDSEQTQRVTPQQAADILGISTEAVRQRIRRGRMRSDKDAGGRVYVYLDASQQKSTDDVQTHERSISAAHSDYLLHLQINSLQEQVNYLRQQLDQANERDREQRRVISALLTQRKDWLEHLAYEREWENVEPEPPKQLPWWRKLFGAGG
jgi:predicted site-specific integrase-resolvase